jgi:hypothetical protein
MKEETEEENWAMTRFGGEIRWVDQTFSDRFPAK